MEGRKGRTVPVNDHCNCEEQPNNFLPGTPWPYFFTLFRITVMRHPAKMQSLRGGSLLLLQSLQDWMHWVSMIL